MSVVGASKLKKLYAIIVMALLSALLTPMQANAGTPWTQVYRNDFSQDMALGSWPGPYASSLYAHDGFYDHGGYYKPKQTLSAANGYLSEWVLKANVGGTMTPIITTISPTIPGGDEILRGRMIIRYGVFPEGSDSMTNWSSTNMLLAKSHVWNDGEVNWPEGGLNADTGGTAGIVVAFNHTLGNAAKNCSTQYRSDWKNEGWHEYIIDWTPSYFRFYRDGIALGTSTCALPTKPMDYFFQISTLDRPISDNSHGHILIDYIQVDRYTP